MTLFIVTIFQKQQTIIAETKGSEQHRDEIEVAKNLCAKKLFAKLNGGNVHYDVVNSYQQLMDVMNK